MVVAFWILFAVWVLVVLGIVFFASADANVSRSYAIKGDKKNILEYAKARRRLARAPIWPLDVAIHGGAWLRNRRSQTLEILKKAERLKADG